MTDAMRRRGPSALGRNGPEGTEGGPAPNNSFTAAARRGKGKPTKRAGFPVSG